MIVKTPLLADRRMLHDHARHAARGADLEEPPRAEIDSPGFEGGSTAWFALVVAGLWRSW
jgi:hypothetical protein